MAMQSCRNSDYMRPKSQQSGPHKTEDMDSHFYIFRLSRFNATRLFPIGINGRRRHRQCMSERRHWIQWDLRSAIRVNGATLFMSTTLYGGPSFPDPMVVCGGS
ncbi:hypothetical protein FKM82_024082 [Ascaphus truei]